MLTGIGSRERADAARPARESGDGREYGAPLIRLTQPPLRSINPLYKVAS
ncbi:hypothetical protein BLAT2472_30643 [Burkholderia latens]